MVDTKTRRVLIYRLGSLGDMVVALPALRLVARAFPDAERRLMTNLPVHAKAPTARAVLDGTGLVDEYFGYPVGTRSPWELLKLVWAVRRWQPEVVVYLAAARGVETAQRDAKFLRYCGVKQIVGLPETEGMQRNFYGAETDVDCRMNWEPEAQRLVRCVAELGDGLVGEASSWNLRLTDAEKREAARQIGAKALGLRPIALSVGTKVQAKDWGIENWRELVARLVKELPGRTLMLVGAFEESAASEYAATAWRAYGGPVVNLCGRLNPRQSAAALERAEIFIGHDSGPMHLAASVGTPCVAVFAARNIPRQWYPLGGTLVARTHRVIYHEVSCGGCGLETCVVEQKRCLTSVTVDEVMEAVMQGIGNRDRE